MSLGSRIGFVGALIFILLSTLNYFGLTRLVLPEFTDLEQREARLSGERLAGSLQNEQRHLDGLTTDWAAWDQTYEYVTTRNSSYVKQNLTPVYSTLKSIHVDMLLIVDSSKTPIWSAVVNPSARRIEPVEFLFDSPLQTIAQLAPSATSPRSGIILSRLGPLLVSSHPITDNRGGRSPQGYLVMGQLFYSGIADVLKHELRSGFSFWSCGPDPAPLLKRTALPRLPRPSEIIVHTVNRENLFTYLYMQTLFGNSGVLFEIPAARPIHAAGARAINYALLGNTAVFLILTLLFLILIRAIVTSPINKLQQQIKAFDLEQTENPHIRPAPPARSDEIGLLQSRFDQLVSRLADRNRQLEHETSERRQAELNLQKSHRKYKEIFNESIAGIIVFDRDHHITDCNPSALHMFGTSREELRIHVLNDLVDDPVACTEILHELKHGRPVFNFEDTITTGSGQQLHVIHNLRPLFDDQGRATGAQSTLINVTELKRAESSQKELERQLLQSQKMEAIGQLTGGIAHDFNNILAVIQGYSSIAQKIASNLKHPGMQGYLKEITESSSRAARLVEELLLFSRGGSAAPAPVSIEKCLSEMTSLLKISLPASIGLTIRIDPALPRILIDPTQFEQTVMNLCLNARDAMWSRGQLEISAHRIDSRRTVADLATLVPPVHPHQVEVYYANQSSIPAGSYVLLSVSDTGKGIPGEVMEKIFEPFFTTKDVGAGSGMGLAVIHGIVHRAGGRMRVESTPGQGTIFRILFPALESEPRNDGLQPQNSVPG